MNNSSTSRANASVNEAGIRRVLVWDAPVRIFHWLMALSFAGAYLTAESERWRLVHVTLGYTVGGLVIFRIAWGLIGTRYARFSDFMCGPKAVASYFRALLRGRPEHYPGHNPAGALAILALLGLALAVTGSGWAHYYDIGGEALEEIHEVLANVMLAIVGIHIAAVLLSSWLHRENLVAAMITGRKLGIPEQGISNAWRGVAAVILVAVLGFWWWQWQNAPADAGATHHHADSVQEKEHDRDARQEATHR